VSELVVRADVAAPASAVWAALTDWAGHDRWMLFTRAEGDNQAGGSIRAFTGLGPVGFTDTMTIVVWEPPRRAVVRHTGRVVRGSGAFEVEPLGPHRGRPCRLGVRPARGPLGSLLLVASAGSGRRSGLVTGP
jgi:hypothetical protein